MTGQPTAQRKSRVGSTRGSRFLNRLKRAPPPREISRRPKRAGAISRLWTLTTSGYPASCKLKWNISLAIRLHESFTQIMFSGKPTRKVGFPIRRNWSAKPQAGIDRELSGWIYPELLIDSHIHIITAVIHRSVFDAVGGFDGSFGKGSDYDFWIRASRKFEAFRLSRAGALYRLHRAGITGRIDPVCAGYEILTRAVREYGLAGPDGREADVKRFPPTSLGSLSWPCLWAYLEWISVHRKSLLHAGDRIWKLATKDDRIFACRGDFENSPSRAARLKRLLSRADARSRGGLGPIQAS